MPPVFFFLAHVLCVKDTYGMYDGLHVITAAFGLNIGLSLFCLLHSVFISW